jgi:hypothetical protein
MPRIVLSYRRADSDAIAGRIRDRLAREYGDDSVFMDIDSIPFGTDFREHIENAIAQHDAVLAVVGRDWVGPKPDGTTRIAEDLDFVRIEIETAMKVKIPVVPLLVNGAVMPKPEDLPAGLRDFAFRNAAQIDSGRDFHQHMDRLIRSLDRLTRGGGHGRWRHLFGPAMRRRAAYIAGALVLAAGAVYSASVLLQRFRNPLAAVTIPDPRMIGTPEDLGVALQNIEKRKADLSRDQINAISEELTAKLLPSDENVMPRVRRRYMNEKLVNTLLLLNDRDLSYVWRRLPGNLDLTDLDLSRANLTGVKFEKTFVIYTKFRDAQLDDAVFDDAFVRNSDFAGASLSEIAFPDTDWFNAFSLSADLRNGQPIPFGKWQECPDGYKADAVKPFVGLLEDWYDVKFRNLSQQDTHNLTDQWKLYAKEGGVCDVVNAQQAKP